MPQLFPPHLSSLLSAPAHPLLVFSLLRRLTLSPPYEALFSSQLELFPLCFRSITQSQRQGE